MALFDIWEKFGFKENPYDHRTLPASEEGAFLIAGRDAELQSAMERIATDGASPTFEGAVGAGKTSLINVATFKLYEASMAAREGELWLPAVRRMQPTENASEFEAEVYRIVLETLIKHRDDFGYVGLKEPQTSTLDYWLNQPEYKSWQGGGGLPVFNVNAGAGHEPNTSEGFQRSGLPNAVRQLLAASYEGGTGRGYLHPRQSRGGWRHWQCEENA